MTEESNSEVRKREAIQEIPAKAFVPFNSVGGPLQECIFPLVAIVADAVYPVGSAFAIHPDGLLMTSAHVLEYAESFAELRRRADGTSYRHYELHALYVSAKLATPPFLFGGQMPVDRIWAVKEHDIALALARLPQNVETGQKFRFRIVRLRPCPPKVGDPILAVGYHMMEASRIVDGKVDYKQETATSTAEVTEVFDVTRDRCLANFPCFHVNARFDPGMSGGPIFDSQGTVCGVVSRGMSPDEKGEYLSLGASIWPALGMKLDINIDKQAETLTLYELARRRLLDVDKSIESVFLTENGVGIRY
ncbi:MAG: trypsin-like peptidase domain-containing protein [Nitrospirae bacterium]|nr:trypsin-like peptidase domain-containing protein [Nitrospirota bacterium]